MVKTENTYPGGSLLIHEAFSACADFFPHETAVMFNHHGLTYHELDHQSSRLAHHLLQTGLVKPFRPVGIGLERGLDVVVAILGVLKAGGAYLPLDPAYPPDRIAFIAEDSRMSLLLSHSRYSDQFSGLNTKCLYLDSLEAEISGESVHRPTVEMTADDSAYVIYTSGSTGRPKGVCCHHRGAMNLLWDFQHRQAIGRGDRGSWWTSLNFDVSVYEIFAPLTAGAALVIVPEALRPDAPALMEWLCTERVTSAYLPPMMVEDLDVWVRENPGRCTLRRLLVGVEPIPEALLNAIDEKVPALRIINGYGPTETTVCATLYNVGPENTVHENVPIGKPVRNMRIHLLDSHGQPVKEGEPGEIWIGGVGVAHGYLNRPELTSERFLPDPFSADPEARIYRTGDMARRLPDGNLVFVGRQDFQVKFHGYRIELGEIETLLRRHSAVREAAVLLREDRPGVKQLVAYVVGRGSEKLQVSNLMEFVKKFLPEYMRPSIYVQLDRIPITPNGKTDRKALPVPGSHNTLQREHVAEEAPLSKTEKAVAKIYESVLKIEGVGAHDNFFALGGHSLLATRVCSAVSGRWKIRISLSTFFDHPTVHELSKAVDAALDTGATNFSKDILPVAGERKWFPATCTQEGIWLLHHLDPEKMVFNIPLIITVKGPLRAESLRRAVAYMVHKYEILRTSFSMKDGALVQEVHPEISFDIAQKDVSHLTEADRIDELERISRSTGAYRMDLSRPPLMKMVLVRMGDDDFRLVLTIHHLLIDGWGASLFFRELSAVYEDLICGKPLSKSPPHIQYGDVAVWQKKHFEGPLIGSQARYWENRLRPPRARLNFFTSRPRLHFQSFRGARVRTVFSKEVTRTLQALAHKEDATLFMVLLSAFNVLLYRYCGETDVIVGSTIANRNHPQLEDVIGVFINSLALRTDLSGNPSFKELLGRVRQTTLEAYDHQDIPYERVAEALCPEQDARRTPIFQVLFILQNTPPSAVTSQNMSWSYEEVGNQTAKVDILLNLEEKEDGLAGWFEYSRDLFHEADMRQMAKCFEEICMEVSKKPESRLSELRDFLIEKDGQGALEKFAMTPGCYILGEGSLPCTCGEILLKEGFKVYGLISTGEDNLAWAEEKGIPFFDFHGDLEAVLLRAPFDYLFSIVNSRVLPPRILQLPREFAVNYHDGPLPRYAGMYATAWAIMNKETEHGVTWHIMDEGLDTGDILAQELFPVQDEETSLSLNAKCYEAATRCFSPLANALSKNRVERRPQDLSGRTCFGLYERPSNGGLISWDQDAGDIHAMVRALDFGEYDNPLGLAKIEVAGEFFLLIGTGLLKNRSGKPAGTIVGMDAQSVRIATGDGDIAILRLKTMDGAPLSPRQWIGYLNLSLGDRLPSPELSLKERYQRLHDDVCRHEAYWVSKLAALKPLHLPFEPPNKPNTCSEGPAFVALTIPDLIMDWFEKDENGISGGIFAAISAFLFRVCQTETFDLGFRPYTLSDRIVGLSGCFAPYVPLRVSVNGEKIFSRFTRAFHGEMDAAIKHITFSRDVLCRYSLLGRQEIGQVGCPYGVAMETVRSFEAYQPVPGPELVWVISTDSKKCRLVYDPVILDGSLVQDLADRFNVFLERLSVSNGQPMMTLPLLTDAEFNEQVFLWNDTEKPLPENPFVHQRFEVRVKETPDAVALVHGGESLTYGELNSRANRLSHRLKRMGVSRGDLVGLFLDRSFYMITGILAILKAGGAYVPLDPRYPFERITLMLRDSRVSTVLTRESLKALLEKFHVRTVVLDEEVDVEPGDFEDDPKIDTVNEDPAYVIYTSGSTGTPKGVTVLHGGVANHALSVSDQFGITRSDRVAQFFSISFDGAVEEIFMTLTRGASLVLLPFDPLPSMNVFMEWVEKSGITVLDLPSAFWHEWMHWLADSREELPASLRAVIVGGEKASESAFATWAACSRGRVRWFNTYGPTETTVVSTVLEPDRDGGQESAGALSIGRPIANTRIYVVDGHLQPVPVGMPGEMLIGGAGVAKGYFHRPDLTAQKFIPDPFRKEGRVYRTGDRVRYRPDGQIDYLGRLDTQAKIRGFRVEPGEVESMLCSHPTVGQGAVAVKTDLRGEKCLVGYVVPKGGEDFDETAILQFLRQKLPPYLVPASLMTLESLPRLPNGKVDRRSLPEPEMAASGVDGTCLLARTPLEKQITSIWEHVLGIQKIGIQDNFFELGGHSLLAVRLCSEVEKELGRRIPLQSLLQAPTIEKFCETLSECGPSKTLRSLVEIQAGNGKTPLFFIHVLGTGLHFCLPLVKYLGKDQPVYGLSVHLVEGPWPVPNRVEDLASHYIEEMRSVQPRGPYLLTGVSFGGRVAYEMARQLLAAGERPALLALLDTDAPGGIQFASTTGRASAHWDMFREQGISYVLEKLGWRIKRLRRSLQLAMARFRRVYVVYRERTGRTLNAWQRDFKARWENQTAMDRYELKPYDGRVILFRSQERILGVGARVDPKLGWGPLAKQGVEVIEAPSSHLGMLQEPYVQFVGEHMKEVIDRSIRNYSSVP